MGCWESRPDGNRPPGSAPWASRVIDPGSGGRSRVQFVPLDEVDPAPGAPRGRHLLWDDLEA